MKVVVVGPGGVGGYLAARLAAFRGAEVVVVARGAHGRAIARDGLRLESPHGDLHVRLPVAEDPAALGPVDLVLLTTKAVDVAATAPRLASLVADGTQVVTFQNGIDSPDVVARVVGRDAVLPGIAYIFSTVAEPGVVRHTAGPARFVFGEATGTSTGRAAPVASMFAAAGIAHEVVEDVEVALWEKFTIICATAGATAPSRLPIDVLREDPSSRELLRRLASEAAAVGRATGVALPADTVDRTMAFVDSLGPDAYSSLLYDLVHGKPMELETLHGTIVRLADEHDVAAPVTWTVHALLSPWARRNGRGGIGSDDASRAVSVDRPR